MNSIITKIDNSSTSGSINENFDDKKVSEEKMLELLKLVYYERKSIKQCASYLKINYNSAKKVIKNFRKNKITIDTKEDEYEKLICGLKPENKEESLRKRPINVTKSMPIVQAPSAQTPENTFFSQLMLEIQNVGDQLKSLSNEVVQNQDTLRNLIFYTNQIVQNLEQNKI